MRQAFEKFINEHHLLHPGDKVLVAVSGGADSVALCYLLHHMNIDFIIAHCNYQLRGEESDQDEKFVIELADKLGVKVFVKHFNTKEIARGVNKSVQMIARELRYNWFNELKVQNQCTHIATAHHKNDSLETVLLNLTRGTGLAGLHGIKVKSNDLIRPLLFTRKEDILEFLHSENIIFREDSSNSSDKYYRNLIRNKVIPQLKTINPNLEETFSSFTERISDIEEIVSKEFEKFKTNKTKAIGDLIYFDIQELKEEVGLLSKLFRFLDECNFTYDQCKSIMEALDKQSGKEFITETHRLVKDRKHLILSPIQKVSNANYLLKEAFTEFATPYFTLFLKEIEKADFVLLREKYVAQIDYDKLQFPLQLRPWRNGDYFYPLGMKQRKKLSDFFIDIKIPLPEKQQKWVLVSGEDIVWILGERIDDRFKITDETVRIYEMQLNTTGLK